MAYYNSMRNTLLHYRKKLALTQKEMALFLGVKREHYNRWENQKIQPDINSLYWVWKQLKTEFPEINMQDLLSYE